MEPVTITAATIATLAFTKFLESSVSKLSEKFTETAIAKMDQLRQLIWQKLRGNPRAETTLAAVEQGSKPDLERLTVYLQDAMEDDSQFAAEVETIAKEIQQEISIGAVQGKNVQNVFGGEAYQVNDSKAPVIQGGSGHTISISYNNSPD